LLTHGAEPFSRSRHLCSHSWTSQQFIEPKVPYRLHKNRPLVPILSHINPIYTIPSYLSKIDFNVVHSPMSWFSQRSLSFWFFYQYLICISLLPHSCYMTWSFSLYLEKSTSWDLKLIEVQENCIARMNARVKEYRCEGDVNVRERRRHTGSLWESRKKRGH
jgi:hypothetical protein